MGEGAYGKRSVTRGFRLLSIGRRSSHGVSVKRWDGLGLSAKRDMMIIKLTEPGVVVTVIL